MLENIGNYTPENIIETINKCCYDLKSSNLKDKRSREILEKVRKYNDSILKETQNLEEQKNTPLKDIILEDKKYDYTRLKDNIFNFLFFLISVKNERVKISSTADTVARFLNKSLFL